MLMKPEVLNNKEASPVAEEALQYPNQNNVSYSATVEPDNAAQLLFTASKTEISSGPLPHPDLVKGYNEIIPDGAERIMRMAEKEQDNRFIERQEIRDTNKEIALGKLKYMNRGQIMGFIIAIVMLGLATLFVFTNHESIACFLFSIGTVSLVALFLQAFIAPKHKQKE